MVEMRQPFFSVVSAIVFAAWGLFFGLSAILGWNVVVGGWGVTDQLSWLLAGLHFLMSYFSLAHLQHR